jgi:hypothetical protein
MRTPARDARHASARPGRATRAALATTVTAALTAAAAAAVTVAAVTVTVSGCSFDWALRPEPDAGDADAAARDASSNDGGLPVDASAGVHDPNLGVVRP